MRGEGLIAGLRQARRPPICVAGFPRSGTTWLSTTLAGAPGLRAYHEPFNSVTVPSAADFDFHYAPADHEDPEFDALVAAAFAGRVEGPHVEMNLPPRYRQFRFWPGRTMVKTVFGVLALERIARLSEARHIVITRDPLDVAASWHRLGWDPGPHLASLRAQPRLMADHLSPFERTMEMADDFWTRFGVLWGATHLVLRRSIARNPDWTVLRFRSLCADPVRAYRQLFSWLGLTWTDGLAQQIREATRTTSSNPFRPERVAERQVGKWRRDGLDDCDLDRLRNTLSVFEDALPPDSNAVA